VEINSRVEVLKMLNAAVANATAGEIHRAVDFLRFAREVRVTKHQIRRKSRKAAAIKNRHYNVRTN
jgi:hypothetical protein